MEISSGLLIIQDNRMLLVHPTNSPDYGSYSIPKGKLNKGESILDAAIRETYEEIGYLINIDDIENMDSPNVITYVNKQGKEYKKVYYYILRPKDPINIDRLRLEKREVDKVGFFDKFDSSLRIFWRFDEMLDYIS